RGDDVVRGHLLAVVELDALAELEGVDEVVLADRVALGQHRDRAVGGIERVEPFVNVIAEGFGDGRGRPVDVERRRLAEDSHPKRAALLLSLGVQGGQGQQGQRPDGGRRAHAVYSAPTPWWSG